MKRISIRSLENVEINSVSDRSAMGLPESYVSLIDENLEKEVNELLTQSRSDLVSVVESRIAPIQKRLAAGKLLAILGDPRIKPLSPDMVMIPAAKVTIGLKADSVERVAERYRDTGCKKDWIEKECPEFKVDVAAFAIGKYPVTNLEFLQFLKCNPDAEIPSSWTFGRYPSEASNHPVHTISPETADLYAKWLSRETGRQFRLPTEIEWEYAASGASGNEFPWGNDYMEECGNSVEEGLLFTSTVGLFPRGVSPFGCFDMSGNVEEYTASDYHPYKNGAQISDDLLLQLGTYRIARGGSFARLRDLMRSKRRHGRFPRAIYVMGFRLAETL